MKGKLYGKRIFLTYYETLLFKTHVFLTQVKFWKLQKRKLIEDLFLFWNLIKSLNILGEKWKLGQKSRENKHKTKQTTYLLNSVIVILRIHKRMILISLHLHG